MTNLIDEGIVTLADDDFFPGLILLYQSIQESYPVPVVCFDGGLTGIQRTWSEKYMPLLDILPIPDSDSVNALRHEIDGTSPNGTREWLLWLCPYLIASSPFQRTLWLDSDIVVLRHLGKLFELMDEGPLFTPENHAPEVTPNSPELYDLLPIDRPYQLDRPLVNAGVSGWDLARDKDILNYYQLAVTEAVRDTRVRNAISWHDQGALIWALQKSGAGEQMLDSNAWNYCIKHSKIYGKAYSNRDNILKALRRDYEDINLLHWNGVKLPDKLSSRLSINVDFNSTTINEFLGVKFHGNGAKAKNRFKIKLVSYLGINSSPVLVDNFFDHYVKMGVEEFLIILHVPHRNKRCDTVEQILKSYDVLPWRIVDTYSAPLKHSRCNRMVTETCTSRDWILYADTDELQVYPDVLRKYLDQCEEKNYSFVRGVFADRIAESGLLPEMIPDASLWEQFPYVAPVTSTITGGWNRKVCAARGSRIIADGGSHALDYDVDDAVRNYRCTSIDPSGHPVPIDIHHFKWDATLHNRLYKKFNMLEGDRESIDGAYFIHEYHRLKDHLDHNGRLAVENMERIGTPDLKYQYDSDIGSGC